MSPRFVSSVDWREPILRTPDQIEEPDLRDDVELRAPKRYRVVMHNDDYTTMEFVIQMLVSVFRKSRDVAYSLMMQIHVSGSAPCGSYPRQIAEAKVSTVHRLAREAGFPLRCSMEEE